MPSSTDHGVVLVEPSVLDQATATHQAALFYRVDTSAVASRADFFDAVRTALPMDPPLLGRHSWDALSDSLWSGLQAEPDDTALIVLTDLTPLRDAAPEEFRTALAVLDDIADTLTDPVLTVGRPTYVRCLVGLRTAAR